MSNQKPTAFNYNDYVKVKEENAALQAQLAQVTAARDADPMCEQLRRSKDE